MKTEEQQTEENFFNSFNKETKKISTKDYNNMVYKHILKNLDIDTI